MGFSGLQRVEEEEVFAGDIVSVSGIEGFPSPIRSVTLKLLKHYRRLKSTNPQSP